MKKLVLVLVCTLILTIFIALNYLLWDRENNIESIKNLNANKNATIEALSEQIRNLGETNKELTVKLQDGEDLVENLRASINALNTENSRLDSDKDYRDQVIGKLKQITDLQPLQDKIGLWADSINEGDYGKAYALTTGPIRLKEHYTSLQEFSSGFKTAVKSIKVESVKLHQNVMPGGNLGDFIFDVSLSVALIEVSSYGGLKEGLNDKLFTIIYDTAIDDWVIYDISS